MLSELRAVADEERGVQPIAAYYRELLQSVIDTLTVRRRFAYARPDRNSKHGGRYGDVIS